MVLLLLLFNPLTYNWRAHLDPSWTLEALLIPSLHFLLIQTAFVLLTHSLPFIKLAFPPFNY